MGRRAKQPNNPGSTAKRETTLTRKKVRSLFSYKRGTQPPAPSVVTAASESKADVLAPFQPRRTHSFVKSVETPSLHPSMTPALSVSSVSVQTPSITQSIFSIATSVSQAVGLTSYEQNSSRIRLACTKKSPHGPLLALLERSACQLWRRKWDLLLEIVVPLIFVAISIALWAMWGTSHNSQLYYDTYSLAHKYGTQVMRPELSDTTDLCVRYDDETSSSRISGFSDCADIHTEKTFACDADMSLIPLPNVTLCIIETEGWLRVAMFSVRRYLGELAEVPTLDVVIKMQWVALAAGEPVRLLAASPLSGITRNTRYSSVLCSGNLYFVGATNHTSMLIDYLNTTSSLFRYVNDGVVYSTVAAAQAASSGHRLWAIVEVRTMDETGLDLVLHMNNSALPSFSTSYAASYAGGAEYDSVELYAVSGYLTLQKMISDFYMQTIASKDVAVPFFMGSFPNPPFTRVPLLVNARQAVPLIFVMAFLYSVSQQAKRIVLEKELRIREAMLIMGMKQWAVYVCEFLMQLPINVLVCAVAVVMLRATYVTKSNPYILFLLFFLFSLTTIPLAGIIAAFFSRAHLASLVAPVVYLILVIPIFAMTNARGAGVIGVSILSPSAFAAALNVFFQYETGAGCGGAEMNHSRDDPTMAVVLGMLTADFFIYYLLMLYLDAVVPKEWGTPKHPLFFILDPIHWCCGTKAKRLEGGADGRAENGVFETTDYRGDVVSFEGLRKEYSRGGKKFVAVNNLYWGMREGEISVLLGHNGAGKTTVLNMMTGMTQPDAGDCYIYGHSVRMEKDAVRQQIGYCPQHNILWDELTCRDHLEFYGKIKGLKGWELEDAICRMLYETDLLEKMDQPAGSLSGGMKRKLSIAVAFVGGSRLVFLDEPTAGLDVAARRHVWELLKRMARSRTILLTTHYMDEADLLGSRIGIMSQGRLKCTGSSLFLKSRLGVGYSLDVSTFPDADRRTIDKMIVGMVNGAIVQSRNGSELTYQLPKESVDQFPALLNAIDNAESIGIRGYAVAATTLEEVFLKVSEEDMPYRKLKLTNQEMKRVWRFKKHTNPLWQQFSSTLAKRFWNALRDRRMQFFQILCPVVCVLIAMLLNLVKYDDKQSISYTFGMFARERTSDWITSRCDRQFGWEPTASHVNIRNATEFLPNYTVMQDFVLDTWYHHRAPRYGAIICDNDFYAGTAQQTSNPGIYTMYNTSSTHQAPVNFATYYDLYAKNLLGPSVSMNYSTTLFNKAAAPTQFTMMFIGALIMVPFTFLPSVPVAWVVKERQCGSRHLQNLCGLNFFVYWAANFLFDMCAYFITMLLCITIFAIFQRTEFIATDRVGGTFVLFIVYGFTSTVFGYCLSFFFHEYSTAQTVVMLTSFAVGFVLLMLVYVLEFDTSNSAIATNMRWGFRVVPSYCIGEGVINLLQLGMRLKLGQARSVWDMDQLGWTLVYMAAEFPLFCMVTLLADHPWLSRVVQRMRYHRERAAAPAPDEDSDVEDERRAVADAEGGRLTREDVVRVVGLQKTYPNGHAAVKGISFSIFPGEIFGFLGTNGAGKTTTISMLCQQFLPTGGSAYVCRHDVVRDSKAALASVGFCPQFDATLDLLTVEEQLQLYAGIRGIEKANWEELVDGLCTLCELTMYRKTVTNELSGGNRRKLSVAMALVGGPQVLFLDEPSAGMDPVARRGMWTAIQRASRHCSVVLTTHHLEEVEALADTVAIMMRGAVQCFGDKVHLKNKFGSAFELGVLVASPFYGRRLERFVATTFPGAVCNEGDGRRFVYRLPRDRPLGAIFEVVQRHKEQLHITDYSVSQTSMEQIFLQVEKRASARETKVVPLTSLSASFIK